MTGDDSRFRELVLIPIYQSRNMVRNEALPQHLVQSGAEKEFLTVRINVGRRNRGLER